MKEKRDKMGRRLVEAWEIEEIEKRRERKRDARFVKLPLHRKSTSRRLVRSG